MLPLQWIQAAPPGVYVAFSLALFAWHTGAALLGAAVADRLGVSDSSLDIKSDLKKMAFCSLAALSVFLSLFYFTLHFALFILYLLVFLFSLKFAYLGANHGFLLLIVGSGIAGMLTFVPIVARLKLPGVYALYAVLSVAILFLHLRRRRESLERGKLEENRERRIREQARCDPEFATFCWQCRFSCAEGSRCLLRNAGEELSEIRIGPRTLCTSFTAKEQPDLHEN